MANKLTLALGLLTALGAAQAEAKTQIQWWHAMGGGLGQKLEQMVDDFNRSQDEYEVQPVFKGTYAETMTGAIAAFRAHQPPAIVQVFEVGTATMMGAKQAIYPVYQLMADAKEPFDSQAFLPAVTSYYSTQDGRMLSMPFNSSTPVLYYNQALFAKAGIQAPPKTWQEMETVAKQLLAAGVTCGFTTTWQSWTQIENFAARNDLPLGTRHNGFDGLDSQLLFNAPQFVHHIDRLAKWAKAGLFKYGGRESDGMPLFYTQTCAMTMGSSAGLAGIQENMKDIPVGVAPLPYDQDLVQTPRNSIIGGASLWVLRGLEPEVYQGVAKFFTYLASPKVQADWHQFSGYLPITQAAYDLTRQQGFYAAHPGTEVAVLQMTASSPSANTKGLRFGNFLQVREIVNEELEAVWAGSKSAQAALDNAVVRGNEQLRRFEKAQQ